MAKVKTRFISPRGMRGIGMGSPYSETSSSEPVTPKTASGDYYGTGFRNPEGKMVRGSGKRDVTPAKLKTPPTKLA